MTTRRALGALLAVCALICAACGDDDDVAPAVAGPARDYRLVDVENALEGAGLALVRDGPADIAPEVSPPPTSSAHYAARSGVEFDVLIFPTPARARRAHADIADTDLVADGGAYTTAANAVAALPRPPRDGALREVWQTFRRLAQHAGGADAGDVGVAPSAVSAHPGRYLGDTVTVVGTLVRRLPAGARRPLGFEVRGRGTGTLLVVPARDARLPAALRGSGGGGPSPRVRATGTVTRLGEPGAPAVPGEDGGLRFRRGDPVLLASSVVLASGRS
jgi:hypothetical protein